jgi:hypothetical protein
MVEQFHKVEGSSLIVRIRVMEWGYTSMEWVGYHGIGEQIHGLTVSWNGMGE